MITSVQINNYTSTPNKISQSKSRAEKPQKLCSTQAGLQNDAGIVGLANCVQPVKEC